MSSRHLSQADSNRHGRLTFQRSVYPLMTSIPTFQAFGVYIPKRRDTQGMACLFHVSINVTVWCSIITARFDIKKNFSLAWCFFMVVRQRQIQRWLVRLHFYLRSQFLKHSGIIDCTNCRKVVHFGRGEGGGGVRRMWSGCRRSKTTFAEKTQVQRKMNFWIFCNRYGYGQVFDISEYL